MDAINWSIDWTIVGPAFLAGLVVLSTHVPLGQEVLRRGIIFIDLAIAQVAGLGVIAAHAMDWDPNGLEVELAAVSAALLAAIGLHWTEKRW
ncbi:MAG: metal ABC transporter permease, partial [Gammaproteobacteria bacterium]|nr:metal ABC transporter permease [Gammaproteobacteria bacterium]